MEPTAQNYAPAKPAGRKFGAKQAAILVVILLIITGGVLFMSKRNSSSKAAISPTPTEAPTEIPTPEVTATASPSASPTKALSPTQKPTPTKKPEVKAATDMSIQILNGSGEVGVASTVKDYLKGKGYQYFETGNADNFDYKDVTVKVKSSLDTYGSTLKKDLGGKYKIASDSASLPNDSVFDAVVTVGK